LVVRVVGLSVAGMAALLVLAAALLLWSSSHLEGPSLTTDTRSTAFSSSGERVAFLGRYVKLRDPVTDAAFHIVYHDNGGLLPGPSDWSIVAAMRVSLRDEAAWLADAKPVSTEGVSGQSASPTSARPEIPASWNVTSVGTSYVRAGVLLVWHPEGVLELSASTF